MVLYKRLLASLIALLAVEVVSRRRHVKPAVRSEGNSKLHLLAREVDGSGATILMSEIPRRQEPDRKKPFGQPPGLSEMRITYKLPRVEISESLVGVTQPIDDHWCEDFNLAVVPFGCSCWRYEYLAYFCVDWSCTNGHSSDYAMCQFLNVSWPIDPPRRRVPHGVSGFIGGIKTFLKNFL